MAAASISFLLFCLIVIPTCLRIAAIRELIRMYSATYSVKRSTAFAFALGAVGLFAAPVAFAQPQSAAASAAAAEAAKFYQEGFGFAQKGDFAKAKTAFAASYQRVQNPRVLFNLALAERKVNENVAAAEHFAVYGSLPDADTIDAKGRADAARNLAELQHELCTVNLVGPPGMTSKVAGRAIRGVIAFAQPGSVALEMTSGIITKKREVACAAGQTYAAEFDEKMSPGTALPPTGPAAHTTPPTGPAVITTPGTPIVAPNAPPEYVPEHDEKRPIFLYLALGTGVLGVAGMVGGGIAGGKSSDYLTTFQGQAKTESCRTLGTDACTKSSLAAANATSAHSTSVALWVAGGTLTAVAAAFTILYIAAPEHVDAQGTPPKANGRSPRRVAAPTARLAPTLDGAMLFGQF
jgi:hypothetical protein